MAIYVETLGKRRAGAKTHRPTLGVMGCANPGGLRWFEAGCDVGSPVRNHYTVEGMSVNEMNVAVLEEIEDEEIIPGLGNTNALVHDPFAWDLDH